MPAKILTAEDAAALLAHLMHARTRTATRRHYTVTGVKTLCGGGVMLPERWAVDGVEESVSLEDLFMESNGPREYCLNCDKVRARLERQAAPALEAAAAAGGMTPTAMVVQPYTVPSLAAWIAPGRTVVVDGLEITDAKVEEMRECLARGKNTELAREVWVGSIMCLDRITETAARALITAAATCPNCDAIHETGMTLTVELTTCPGQGTERGEDHEHGEDCGAYGAACFTDWDAAHEWARAATLRTPGDAAVYLLGEDGVPTHELAAYMGGEAV